MYGQGVMLVSDVASSILEIVPEAPCTDDGLVCTLRSLVDYMVPVSVVFGVCIGLGFVLALSVSVVSARIEKTERRRPGRRPAPVTSRRVVSGPVHTDGRWVRVVEERTGERTIEVLVGADWRATPPDLGPLALDLPTRPR